ncbi:MAG TPA: hypothetical protein VFW20_09715 [Candidatus Limnocylindrales bacterium]|nr:hypothetical protein [Candidatus Limnocylindrales bacterium]
MRRVSSRQPRTAGRLELGSIVAGAEGSSRFTQGLMLGAMVGAAIAGSTLWARIRRARRQSPHASSTSGRRATG